MAGIDLLVEENETFSIGLDQLEDVDEDYIQSRIRKLGFKPQRELSINRLLPYSDQLDNESQRLLIEIKGNLGRAVLLKELKPGCLLWTHRLQKYINMFGIKFSKEDHLTFIKLVYELLTIPRLEPFLVYRFATCLTLLLKKKYLISREELTLEWRPLYDLCDHLLCTSNATIGMYRYSSKVENSLAELLVVARLYFPVSATQEMLDMWRPQLCPFDTATMQGTVEILDSFLPSIFLPSEPKCYELWFNEFMDLWKTCHNTQPWEPVMMNLISRLASYTIGSIDWEPHMALMYTRVMRSFSLPVLYKKMKVSKNHKMSVTSITIWIVSTLGGGSSSQAHLTRMMKVLESYLHPANTGSWVTRLQEFLRKLPFYFMLRLTMERHHNKGWLPQVPEWKRLSENDITEFVESLRPTVSLAMYSHLPPPNSQALQYLASLRPVSVIPPIIDSLYSALDSLTEPHKYTAAMLSLVSVARPLLEANEYKLGPTHVIPLLMAVLPGIDPNDVRKCFITFQVITTFTSMIPLVDASKASEYWKDLTEEEEAVCAASSQFEDFVLEFMDRCFTLVDNSVLETTRLEQQDHHKQQRSRMENVVETAIVSTFTSLLGQTSPQIFKSALRKLHTFATSRILETTVSGKCIASICRTFAKVRPDDTLKLLVPHVCNIILTYTEHEDIRQEETLDNELLYNLLLLSELANCHGKALLNYSELLEKVLDLTVHLKCVEGYMLASRMISNMLYAISATRPTEFKSSNQDYGQPISDYLPIRDWGRPYEIGDVVVEWYRPGEEEVRYTQHLIKKYLVPELDTIKAYSTGSLAMTREELLNSLSVVQAFLGAARIMPVWDEPSIPSIPTCLERRGYRVECANSVAVTMPDGSNVRKAIATSIMQLQAKLLASAEDDTKSLISVVTILDGLLMNMSPSKEEFAMQTKALMMGKKIYENKLLGKKRHIRSILVNRVFHQHEHMLISTIPITQTHADLMTCLLQLATSHYSEVRKIAQAKLNSVQCVYTENTFMTPKIVELLSKDSNLYHEQFKGALYVILGPKDHPWVARRNWSVVRQLWPALVKAQPSEKPSVITLLNAITDTVLKHFPTICIDIEIKDKGEEAAKLLWENSTPTPELSLPSSEEISAAQERLAEQNKRNKSDYLELLDSLLDCIHSNIHWRFHAMTLGFLRELVHPDCNYPPQVIREILNTLIHDNIEFRKIAIRCTVYILKQQKRKHKYHMINMDPSSPVTYGDRDDNQWLQYNSKTAPRSQAAWDEPRYAHNPYIGYYSWPKEVKVCSPSAEQPSVDRTRDQLDPGEQEVHDFFSDPHKIQTLISFLSLEEKKGKDKFNCLKFILFKNLFRNYGDKYLNLLKPHLKRLVEDSHESSQRCAAEIITGLIRGSKHWPYEKVESMWEHLTPLLRTGFTNMTVETVNDWSVLAATASENRDPNRHHWFLELLMEDPLREEASFLDCGRLCVLQGALNQQEWRVVELFHRLLDYLRPRLSHPYQLLRERIGSVLTNIFALDLPTSGERRTRGPLISQFVTSIIPQLVSLYSLSDSHQCQPQVNGNQANKKSTSDSCSSQMEVDLSSKPLMLDENGKNSTICLLKTMVKWVTNSVVRADFSAIPEFFAFLPLVCLMENYEADDELNKVCSGMLAALAQALTLPDFIPIALAAIQEVSEMSSWSARATCLEFLQVFVFHNQATIASQSTWLSQVNSMVLRLLKDERVEVREKAGQVLSGLIHCGFISDTHQLVSELQRLATRHKAGGVEVAKRHAGVLGLCAVISAFPYDVVDPVPQIFLLLGSHLNDPQPIPSSIRKTLGDFKRTHHDNWEQHKLKFSEEQLAVLTDLIVPPSYYA